MGWKLFEYNNAFSKAYEQCSGRLKESVDSRMAQLLEHGNAAKQPVSKPLKHGLFELRGDAGRQHVRFVYFFQPGQRIIFVVGSLKDQRTLPKRTLQRARQIRETLLKEPELLNVVTQIH